MENIYNKLTNTLAIYKKYALLTKIYVLSLFCDKKVVNFISPNY